MRLFFVLIALVSQIQGFAQSFQASGSVKSEISKSIPFATISVPSKNLFFSADSVGRFQVFSKQIDARDTIFISCVGYITNKLVAKDMMHSALNIRLIERVQVLDELVIKAG